MKFTSRQKLLFDRLVQLGELATNDRLPSQILEISGFGSFFRGKPKPTDVDLFIRYERLNHKLELKKFRSLITGLFGVDDIQETYETPKDAIIGLSESSHCLFVDVNANELQSFLEWIEGYSWSMLCPKTLAGQLALEGSQHYTYRMLKRLLPNLNIAVWVDPKETGRKPGGLRCGFSELIWTPERVDVASNVMQILSDDCVRKNLVTEISYFDVQLPVIRAEVEIVETEINVLLELPRLTEKNTNSICWFEKISATHPLISKLREKMFAERKVALRFDAEYDQGTHRCTEEQFTLDQALSIADEKRLEIKNLYRRFDGLEKIRNELLFFKAGAANTQLDAHEYVSNELLKSGSKTQKQEMTLLLESLGFPVAPFGPSNGGGI